MISHDGQDRRLDRSQLFVREMRYFTADEELFHFGGDTTH